MAEHYLTFNTRNRRCDQRFVARLAADMADGNFVETHQGIAFDVDKALCDGQQRLQAIIQSGKGQWLVVARGLCPEAMKAIDRNRTRSVADTIKILGLAETLGGGRSVAVARRMMSGPSVTRLIATDTQLIEFMVARADAIQKGCAIIRNGHGPATVAAVIARASYHVPPETLEKFGYVFSSPDADQCPGSKTVVRLQRWMIEMRRVGGNTGGGQASATIYRKTQYALDSFCRGEDKAHLLEIKNDIYPLPEE